MNSLIFPFVIHSDTMTNWSLAIVTPRSGKTFGRLRVFHLITSLQNPYMSQSQPANASILHDMQTAYPSNLGEVTRRIHPQNLGCDPPTLIIAHPHVRVPASVPRDLQSVIAERDLEGSRKQGLAIAYMAQSTQTPPPEPLWETGEIQSLIGGRSKAKEPKKVKANAIRPRLGSEGM